MDNQTFFFSLSLAEFAKRVGVKALSEFCAQNDYLFQCLRLPMNGEAFCTFHFPFMFDANTLFYDLLQGR